MQKMNSTKIFMFLILLSLLQSPLTVLSITATSTQLTVSDPTTGTQITDENLLRYDDTCSIQDTINQASAGATIVLPAGTYTEILIINKPLHLLGEGSHSTKISSTSSPNGYALCITAKDVTLSNLDITNLGVGLYATGVKITASHTTIQGCIFHDTPIGIALWSSYNTISDCEFFRCTDEGIVLLGTKESDNTKNTISSCVFTGNCDGIELQYASYNTIHDCSFVQNTHAGIDAIESTNNNNIISHCTFTENKGYGLYLSGSSKNQITQSSFSDSPITLIQASDNTISDSTISSIHLMDDSSLLIEDCEKIDTTTIRSYQSSYEIRNDETTDNTIRHPLLTRLLTRFTLLRTLYEKLQK